jgi:hypothetical protein
MDASVSLTRRRSLHSDPKSATRARIHSSGILSPSELWTRTVDHRRPSLLEVKRPAQWARGAREGHGQRVP